MINDQLLCLAQFAGERFSRILGFFGEPFICEEFFGRRPVARAKPHNFPDEPVICWRDFPCRDKMERFLGRTLMIDKVDDADGIGVVKIIILLRERAKELVHSL